MRSNSLNYVLRKIIWQDRGCVPCAYFPKGVHQRIGSYDSLFPNWYQEDQMKVQINQIFFSISNTCMLASGLGLRNNSLVQKIGCVSPVSLHWVLSVVKISDRFTNYLLYLQLFLIYIWLCNVTNYIPVYLIVNSVGCTSNASIYIFDCELIYPYERAQWRAPFTSSIYLANKSSRKFM